MENKNSGLFLAYGRDKLNRRAFLRTVSALSGSTAASLAIFPLIPGNFLFASATPADGTFPGLPADSARANPNPLPQSADDPELITRFVNYPGESGTVRAYMARPAVQHTHPAVIVIHENRGLQPHIMDVTRRMASEGFLALAPDALSPFGGTPDDEDITEALQLNRELDYEVAVKDFVAAVDYLETHPLSTGNVGCTGFCWGGAMTNQVAVNSTSLKAAVPYYGSVPPADQVPRIRASVLAHYASDDPRINQGIPGFREALEKAGIDHEIHIYEGTQHAFNNDTNPDRYHPEAARLAWKRTVEFFREKLEPG